MISIIFTDGSLTPIGQPIVRYKQIVATLYFNAPASVTLTLPALGSYIEMAQPGNRMVVIRDGQILCAGPVETPGAVSWSADGTSDASGPGVLTVASTDDSVWLGCRLVYPDPAHVAAFQTATYYTLTATNAETAMRNLVNLNAGTGALVARRVPNLDLGTAIGVGTNISVRSRFGILSDELRSAALAGGNLGYRIVQDGAALKFVVYQPADLTTSVRFSRGLNNLRALQYQPQAATATVAIVGGDGTGTSRTIVERENTAASAVWKRIETFVSDSGTDTTVLDQSGDSALISAASQSQLIVQAVDTPSQRFGTHYNLGDQVSVEVYPGLDVADIVRAVTITADPTGEIVNPQIGASSASSAPKYVQKLRLLDLRLGQLERTREV